MEDNIWLQAGRFIQKCTNEIESRGLQEPFIYKVDGNSTQIHQLVAYGLDPQRSLLLDLHNKEIWDTKTLASAIKDCLSVLPDSLIPNRLKNQLLQEAAAYNSGSEPASFRKLFLTMPQAQYTILEMLIKHLKRVADNVAETFVDAADLGEVFGPLLVRSGTKLDGVAAAAMISNYSKIFPDIPRAEEDRLLTDSPPKTTSGHESMPAADSNLQQKRLLQVARFLKACIEEIETRGFDEPFLYKTEGCWHKEDWLVDCGLDPHRFVQLDLSNREALETRTIAGAIKECLRRLPDSLITSRLRKMFEQAAGAYESGEGIRRICYLLTKLPEINFKILKMLMKHLKNVQDNVDLTYMRSVHLAAEFGILILRSGSQFGDVVVAALIDNYDKIFRLAPINNDGKMAAKVQRTYVDPVSATVLMIMESYQTPNQSAAIIERYSETIHYHARVQLIKKCIQAVEARGLTAQLLYMEEGETRKVLNLMKMGLNPLTYDSLDLNNRNTWETSTITSAVKCCLRQLRKPLLTNKVQNWFLKPTVLGDPDDLLLKLQSLVCKLPEDNYNLLNILFKHLNRVAASFGQSHAASKLAAVFCTSLINTPNFDENIIYSITIVTKLITNYSEIFRKSTPDKTCCNLHQQQASTYPVKVAESHPAQREQELAEKALTDYRGCRFIKNCVTEIENHRLHDLNLYKEEGPLNEAKLLVMMGIDSEKLGLIDLSDKSRWKTNTITSAVMYYLRSLPGPLMNYTLQTGYYKIGDLDEAVESLKRVVHQLPVNKYLLLEIVIGHLKRLSLDIGVVPLAELATIFTPILLGSKNINLDDGVDTIKLMIKHHERVFRM